MLFADDEEVAFTHFSIYSIDREIYVKNGLGSFHYTNDTEVGTVRRDKPSGNPLRL